MPNLDFLVFMRKSPTRLIGSTSGLRTGLETHLQRGHPSKIPTMGVMTWLAGLMPMETDANGTRQTMKSDVRITEGSGRIQILV